MFSPSYSGVQNFIKQTNKTPHRLQHKLVNMSLTVTVIQAIHRWRLQTKDHLVFWKEIIELIRKTHRWRLRNPPPPPSQQTPNQEPTLTYSQSPPPSTQRLNHFILTLTGWVVIPGLLVVDKFGRISRRGESAATPPGSSSKRGMKDFVSSRFHRIPKHLQFLPWPHWLFPNLHSSIATMHLVLRWEVRCD